MRRRLAVLMVVVLAACASPARHSADVARSEATARDACEASRPADFDAAGAARLERYKDWLARTRGGDVALPPEEVSLSIVRGEPKPSPNGVTAGEVACHNDRGAGPFRITLYREALEGRPLAVAYNTIAHEFQHLVQIRRDHLPCAAHGGALARYEDEARAVADELVPPCE